MLVRVDICHQLRLLVLHHSNPSFFHSAGLMHQAAMHFADVLFTQHAHKLVYVKSVAT